MPSGKYTRTIPPRQIIIPIGPSIAYVPLSLGLFSLIDAEDAESCGLHTWSAMWSPRLKSYYAFRSSKGQIPRITIRLHRQITTAPSDLVVDHLNHNTLDNRKCNLRVCTQAVNMQNIYPGKFCGVRPREGVTSSIRWSERDQRWRVWRRSNGTERQVGSFKDRQSAVVLQDKILAES